MKTAERIALIVALAAGLAVLAGLAAFAFRFAWWAITDGHVVNTTPSPRSLP